MNIIAEVDNNNYYANINLPPYLEHHARLLNSTLKVSVKTTPITLALQWCVSTPVVCKHSSGV